MTDVQSTKDWPEIKPSIQSKKADKKIDLTKKNKSGLLLLITGLLLNSENIWEELIWPISASMWSIKSSCRTVEIFNTSTSSWSVIRSGQVYSQYKTDDLPLDLDSDYFKF